MWEEQRRRQLMAPLLNVLCIEADRLVCYWLQRSKLSSSGGANGLHTMKPDTSCFPGTANVRPVVVNGTWHSDDCAERIFDKMKIPPAGTNNLFLAATRWPEFFTTFVICCVFRYPPGCFCHCRRLISRLNRAIYFGKVLEGKQSRNVFFFCSYQMNDVVDVMLYRSQRLRNAVLNVSCWQNFKGIKALSLQVTAAAESF